MIHKVNQRREKQNLEMRRAYETHAMKYFTPDGSGLQIWF